MPDSIPFKDQTNLRESTEDADSKVHKNNALSSGHANLENFDSPDKSVNIIYSEPKGKYGNHPRFKVKVNNVVATLDLECPLNLREIGLRGLNVMYDQRKGMLTMKFKNPYTTAVMWPTGKMTCTGAKNEEDAYLSARRYVRFLQKLGLKAKFVNYRIVNVLGTCKVPFRIKIIEFVKAHKKNAIYEPERHPGVEYRMEDLKVTLKVFQSGSITITAPSVENIEEAADRIYPLVLEYQREPAFSLNRHVDKGIRSDSGVPEEIELDNIEIDEDDESNLNMSECSVKRRKKRPKYDIFNKTISDDESNTSGELY